MDSNIYEIYEEYAVFITEFGHITEFYEGKNIRIILNGTELQGLTPIMMNDRVIVPLRAFCNAINYDVTWDQSRCTATAVKQNSRITVQERNNMMIYSVNNKDIGYPCNITPGILTQHMMVSIRDIAECAQYKVIWDANKRIVYINN